MRLLLDTHVFLWWIKGDSKLSKTAKNKITQADEVYVSSASIWEISIKIRLKKLDGEVEQIVEAILDSGFLELPITVRHAAATAKLSEIHRDPFDRMLIAQAVSEPLTLITADATLKPYSDLIEMAT
jgi:PIN domain nuclease of toxin-antitoxin system